MNTDRLMRNMMQSMGMPMPFGGIFGDFADQMNPMNPHGHPSTSSSSMMMNEQFPPNPMAMMMPHNFMSPMSMMMMDPFQNMHQAMSMGGNPNGGFSYCSSSVTSYSTDEHGRQQVYQSSNEVKQGPNGLKETKSAVRDSRTGHQELAIGHHLKEKAHIKKKSKNAYTGDEEVCEDLVGIDEAEADRFEQDWQRQARNLSHPSSYNQLQYGGGAGSSRSARNNRLALASSAQEDQTQSSNPSPSHHHTKKSPYSSLIEKVAMKTKKKKKSKDAALA